MTTTLGRRGESRAAFRSTSTQRSEFGASHPGGGDEQPQGVQAILASVGQEGPQLLWGPDLHLRRGATRRADRVGHVTDQVAEADGVSKGPVQHGVDVAHGLGGQALAVPPGVGEEGAVERAEVGGGEPPQHRHPGVAARRRRRAAHRAPARSPGASRLGGPARPGRPGTQANLDHLVIGPGGVLVIDSKYYRGRLWLDHDGMVWHGRHLLVSALRKVVWQADQADEVLGIADVQVAAIVAVHGAGVPWGLVRAESVTIVPARRVPDLLPRVAQACPSLILETGTAPERRLRGGVAAVDDDLGEPAPHDGL